MADVFISYKSERRPAAEHLAEILADFGYSVWWDYGLISGRDFGAQIEKELREAKVVVVLWCSLSVNSEWVREEAALAKRLNKIIPTSIEIVDLPLGFSLAQTLDLSDWDGAPQSHRLERLLRDVAQFVGRPPSPNLEGLDRTERAWRRFGAPSLRDFALVAELERKTPARTLPSALHAQSDSDVLASTPPAAPTEAAPQQSSIAHAEVANLDVSESAGRWFRLALAAVAALVFGPLALAVMRRPRMAVASITIGVAGATAAYFNGYDPLAAFLLYSWMWSAAGASALLVSVEVGKLLTRARHANAALPPKGHAIEFLLKSIAVLIFGPLALWWMHRRVLVWFSLAACAFGVFVLFREHPYEPLIEALLGWPIGHVLSAILFLIVGIIPRPARAGFAKGFAGFAKGAAGS